MKQVTKEQHFVPKFYLGNFADGEMIQVLKLRERRIGKARPYTSVCYDRFFYGVQTGTADDISQEVEAALGVVESHIAERLPAVVERCLRHGLTGPDYSVLALLMSLQWMRTEHFRQRMQELEAKLLRDLMQKTAGFPGFTDTARRAIRDSGGEPTDEAIERLRKFLRERRYELKVGNSTHILFMFQGDSLVGFHNLLLAQDWRVLLAKGRYRFVTTDNPVAEVFPPRKSIYGHTFLERHHYLPVSPDVLIECTNPARDSEREPPWANVQYRDVEEEEVLMYDLMLANHGNRHAYARGKGEFQAMLHEMKHPATVSRIYSTRYPR
jgi:Protein of unknown function (DUF4238)